MARAANDSVRRQDVVMVAVVRWLAGLIYAAMCWAMCHDGTSPSDVTVLLVVGVSVVVLVTSLGWILEGPGQVDREADQ